MEAKITLSSTMDVPLLWQLLVASVRFILFISFLECVGLWLLFFLNTAFFMVYLLIAYVQVAVCG